MPWLTRRIVLWWGIGLTTVAVLLLARYLIDHLTIGLAEAGLPQLGDDFINYWLGARFAAEGQARLAYDRQLFFSVQQSVIGPAANYKFYGYPPVAMLLSLPFACFAFLPALALWTLAGAGLCGAILSRLVGWRLAALAVIGSPAAFLNLLFGQNGYFTAAMLAGGLMLLQARPMSAGIILGLLSYKPQMGLLIPLALLAGGHWRAVIGASASAGLLAIVTASFFGIDTWTAFLDQMRYQQQLLEMPRDSWFSGMPSAFSALRLTGAPLTAAYAAQAISAIGAAMAVSLVWRSHSPFEVKATALVIATFLATPYGWVYDMVVLLFAAAWLARDGAKRGFLPWQQATIAALLALPALMVAGGMLFRVQIAPMVLWLALALLVRRSLAPAGTPLFADPQRLRIGTA